MYDCRSYLAAFEGCNLLVASCVVLGGPGHLGAITAPVSRVCWGWLFIAAMGIAALPARGCAGGGRPLTSAVAALLLLARSRQGAATPARGFLYCILCITGDDVVRRHCSRWL